MGSFLQTNDRRFKLYMAGKSEAYMVHFALLGNPSALTNSAVSTVRAVLALRTRSYWVAAAVVLANIGFGLAIAIRWSHWLRLGTPCVGTIALFLLSRTPMRRLMLYGTELWIANNLIAGSTGSTALEIVVAATNIGTSGAHAAPTHGGVAHGV